MVVDATKLSLEVNVDGLKELLDRFEALIHRLELAQGLVSGAGSELVNRVLKVRGELEGVGEKIKGEVRAHAAELKAELRSDVESPPQPKTKT